MMMGTTTTSNANSKKSQPWNSFSIDAIIGSSTDIGDHRPSAKRLRGNSSENSSSLDLIKSFPSVNGLSQHHPHHLHFNPPSHQLNPFSHHLMTPLAFPSSIIPPSGRTLGKFYKL